QELWSRGAQRRSVFPDRLARRRPVEEDRELLEVDARQYLAPLDGFIGSAAQDVSSNTAALPIPDLADAQRAVHVELVDSARRPDVLAGEVRSALAFEIGAEHVALVRLRTALVLLVLQRPGTVRREIHITLQAPDFDEPPDIRLDQLVRERRAHDLESAFQIGKARDRAVAANLEQPEVVGPSHAAQMDVVVLVRLGAALRVVRADGSKCTMQIYGRCRAPERDDAEPDEHGCGGGRARRGRNARSAAPSVDAAPRCEMHRQRVASACPRQPRRAASMLHLGRAPTALPPTLRARPGYLRARSRAVSRRRDQDQLY